MFCAYDEVCKFNRIGFGLISSRRYKGSKKSSAPTINPKQAEGLATVIDWATPALKETPAGESYVKDLVADTPELLLQAYEDYTAKPYEAFQTSAIKDFMTGTPAYSFDESGATKRWQEGFATPVMETWKETVLPMLKESFNAPGTVFSRGINDYMAKKTSDFYGGQVAPKLFDFLNLSEQMSAQSAENAANRRFSALNMPATVFGTDANVAGVMQNEEQKRLSAAYQEFLRTDPYRYAELIGGLSTKPTQDTIVEQGTDSTGALISGGASILASMVAPTPQMFGLFSQAM
ncbi:MAG: hypothetical protein ACTSXA_00700 [Candidatus Heimdallarchaeota archaeon]